MDKARRMFIRKEMKGIHFQLKHFGFRERLVGAVKFYLEDKPLEKFILLDRYRTEFEKIHYTLHFEKNKRGSYDFKSYDAMLRTAPPVPATIVKGINAGELDNRMKKYEWTIDQHTMDTVSERMQTGIGRAELKEIESIMNGINKLYNNGSGRDAAEELMFKYWMDTPYEPNTLSLDHLREKYEFNLTAHLDGRIGMKRTEAYDFLKNQVAKPEAKTYVISDETLEKAEMALRSGSNWMVYDSAAYFMDKDDVQFFSNENSAKEFAYKTPSHSGNFIVLPVTSIRDLFTKIPYETQLNQPTQLIKQNNQLFNLKTNVMNEQNLDFLKGNLKLTGFGENLNADLEKNLKQGKDEFQLNYRVEINKKPFEATLHFGKSDKADMYFFNRYDASLEKNNKEKVEQTFYLHKGKGVTAKEAFNLLDGRAVHKQLNNKEGVPYKGWLQLDFENKKTDKNFEVKQFHEKYGFDLKAVVSQYPIAELKDPEKEKYLMQSLERGNIQSVTLDKDGTAQKMFIEANPQFKTMNLYDGHMKRVQKEELGEFQSGKMDKGKESKQDQKKDFMQGANKNDSKKNSTNQSQTNSKQANGKTVKNLLPQREDTVSKGMRV